MPISLESLPTGDEIQQSERCLNCNAQLSAEYCTQCGQRKVHRSEFSIKHFFGHLFHEFTHLDSNKIFKTLFALMFRPGLLTSEYLAGKKGRYINPIRVYLTFSALYFLFAWGALSDFRGGNVERTAERPRTIVLAQRKGIEPHEMAEQIHHRAEKYAGALRFASVLVSGLFLSLLYFGTKKYYVEHLIFSLHYYSFDFFCKSLFALVIIVTGWLGVRLPTTFLDFFYPVALIYFMFALRRVYRESWTRTVLKGLVLFTLETLLFIAVAIAGFIISFSIV